MDKKIKVINMADSRVVVVAPEIPYKAVWVGKEAVCAIKFDILEQLMYREGFNNMVQQGILYIEDMDAKKALGIEPEDAKEPVNMIILTDTEKSKLLGSGITLNTFKKRIEELNHEQVLQLADYAIKNELGDFNKSEVIRKACGKDVMQAIKLNHQDKE